MAVKDDESVNPVIPLPEDIVQVSIMPFVDLHSLVRFSNCSKQCGNIVFHDSPPERWREIQFCDGAKSCTINDSQLKILLSKINARENTRVLSLIGCPNIKGTGLEPLSQSEVLEDIDLRVVGTSPLKGEQRELYGATGLNERLIFVILSSILVQMRQNLSEIVVLRRLAVRGERHPINISSTIEILHSEREKLRLLWKPPSCIECKSSSGHWPKQRNCCAASKCQSVLWCPGCRNGLRPYKKCFICRSEYCRDCAPQLLRCSICAHDFCKACAMPPNCSVCTKSKCQWCSNIAICCGCNVKCCASHGFESCGMCDKTCCLECIDEEFLFCVVCNQHYCDEACHRKYHN